MPEGESLQALAAHHCTLCIFLSITLMRKVTDALSAAGWSPDAPVVVVHKASWAGEEKIVRGTVSTIAALCREAKLVSQSMIIASPTLGSRHWEVLAKSKLYDASFTHQFRRASAPSVL
jgi:precorrin-4/cobalt-precorrin-4 C11-methyltransferase